MTSNEQIINSNDIEFIRLSKFSYNTFLAFEYNKNDCRDTRNSNYLEIFTFFANLDY